MERAVPVPPGDDISVAKEAMGEMPAFRCRSKTRMRIIASGKIERRLDIRQKNEP